MISCRQTVIVLNICIYPTNIKMKNVKIISEGINHSAIDLGRFDDLMDLL
jgi:hypothetical protein